MAVNWVVDKIASGIAFAPPKPSYFLVQQQEGNDLEYKIAGHRSLDSNLCAQHKAFLIPTGTEDKDKTSKKIAAVFVEYRKQLSSQRHFEPKTLLFSHGNGEDLGQLLEYIWYLSDRLKVNIMAYDYSGYGVTSGKPSVQQSLKDIQIVFQYIKTEMKIQSEDIILYGQSVGSGPSVYLAATEGNVGGLILHSPLQSGLRVLYPNLQKWPVWCDVYPNYMLVHNIKCPTLIMHGTKDQIIDVSHAKSLEQIMRDSCSYLRTFWAVGYDHSDIQIHPDYFKELKSFLNKCHQLKLYNYERELQKQELLSSNSQPLNSGHSVYIQKSINKSQKPDLDLHFSSPFANVPQKYQVDMQKVRLTQTGKVKRRRFKVINIIYKQDQNLKLIQQTSKQKSGQIVKQKSTQLKKSGRGCAGGIRVVRAKRKKVVRKQPFPKQLPQEQQITNIQIIDPNQELSGIHNSKEKQQRLKSLINKLSIKRKQNESGFISSDEESPTTNSEQHELRYKNAQKSPKRLSAGYKTIQKLPSAKSGQKAIRLILKGMQSKSQ